MGQKKEEREDLLGKLEMPTTIAASNVVL